MNMEPEEVMASGKHKRTICARSLLCYWATSELEISQTFLAEKLKISQTAVSLALNRGKEIAKINHYSPIEVSTYVAKAKGVLLFEDSLGTYSFCT